MRTTIRYFDGWESSKVGLARGLIIFPFCVAASYGLSILVTPTQTNNFFVALVMGLILCSLLGVQDTGTTDNSSLNNVIYYGASIYFCIYTAIIISSSSLSLFELKSLGIIILATVSGILNAFILFKLGPVFN
jgi:hypothetical protein